MSLRKEEWPAKTIPHLSDEVFDLAFALREVTGCVMIPSPVVGAHIRWEDSGSQHAIGTDGSRKSTGTDWFGRNDQAITFWLNAQRVPTLGGFGVYFDCDYEEGRRRIMYHGDTRANRMLWVCPDRDKETQSREYIYYHKEPVRYLQALANGFYQIGHQ